MDYVFVFNAVEVGLWTIFGTVLIFRSMTVPQNRRLQLLAAAAFFAFAGSDVAEMFTGAWWRPWWLLVWKAACVTVLATAGVVWHRRSQT